MEVDINASYEKRGEWHEVKLPNKDYPGKFIMFMLFMLIALLVYSIIKA